MEMPNQAPAPRRRRPLYLFAALAVCFGFASTGALGGCTTLQIYSHPITAVDPADIMAPTEAARVAIANHETKRQQALFAVKKVGAAVASAEFVLGMAMLAVVVNVLARRPGATARLRQLVLVQAIVLIVGFFAMKGPRAAEAEGVAEFERAIGHPEVAASVGYVAGTMLTIRTMLAGLVLLALSRPRVLDGEDSDEPESVGRAG